MPVIKLQEDSSRLIVAGGTTLSTFTFPGHAAKPVEEVHIRPSFHRDSQGRLYNDWIGRTPTDDITSISCIEGTGEFILAHVSGLLQKCKIETSSYDDRRPFLRSICRYGNSKRIIQAVSASKSGLIASVASHSGGTISLYRSNSPWQDPITWRTKHKPWSLLLDPSGSRPRWLALGESGHTPCRLYELHQDGTPVDVNSPITLLGNNISTAVYDFASPPSSGSSPLGDPSHTIVSGWYDGTVRIHDLRRPSRQPTLTMYDPFADVPVYSVACGGGAGCTIAAGTARHGLVRTWDVRKAKHDVKAGTSIFGPGKDSSPVYSLEMEHDRLFGVTDRRAWMMTFGYSAGSKNGSSRSGVAPSRHPYHNSNTHRHSDKRDDTLHRFSKARIHSRDTNQLSYYRHSDMSLRKIT
ncbi:hypothetical protein P389DRAFT_197334 [Cystobasidium minutum MCA 4210]|uniref:uncharacterized protein n=1 Tax=Cystobasidium minutum MCA 4210 TaxID=1397322 RepID=UPI0034CD2E8C|eukprot:jgi/Rhomi1/197334/gm1.5548_g